MLPDNTLNPEQIYTKYLHTISGIKFTPREIDIISCIVAGKNPQSISSFLSIDTKPIELQTVNTHIVNIRRKIDGSARAQILEFIERSDKHKLVHNYYIALKIKKEFVQSLTELIKTTSLLIKKVYFVTPNDANKDLISSLKSYFQLINVDVIIERDHTSLAQIQNTEFAIYFLPPINQYTPSSNHLFLLKVEDAKKGDLNFKYILLNDQQNYYYLFLKILNELLPNIKPNIEIIKTRIQTKYDHFYEHEDKSNISKKIQSPNEQNIQKSFNKKLYTLISIFILTLIAIGGYLYNQNTQNKYLPIIHSDLMIPVPSVLLERNNILEEINNYYRSNIKDVQTVALVGPGGAGKTTIARIYASKQTSDVIWEINAETKVTLVESFIKLAEGLARTNDDKEILQEIRAIQIPTELVDKLILFVKQRLILYPNWLLIFDNIDDISEVQKYIPHDSNTCGSGKVLITTRDSNIKTHRYINHTIKIGELTAEQKLALFSKIVNEKRYDSKQVINFLEHIPPFPLDVSIAAYYIKTTDTSFAQYIIHLNQNSNGFDNIQSMLLKEAGDYNHTRYNIITLSLEHLISSHPDFKDLLLFISLLDSQNIPRELLDKYKNHIIVDSFIYNLKKYSLISGESLTPLGEVFNIHRSTQAISLAYLTQKFDLTHHRKELINKIGKVFWAYISDLVDQENSSKIRLMLAHSKMLLSHDILISEEIKILVETAIGYIYYYLGFDIKSKEHLETSLKKLQHYYGKDHIDPARILTFLAMAIRRTGNYTEAKNLLLQSAAISRKYPEYHMQHARAVSCLGLLHRLLGEYNESIITLSEGAEVAKKHPINQVGIGRSLANLAEIYSSIGLPNEAKKSIDELMSLYTDFDKNQIETIWILNPLGISYYTLGDYEKAKHILERSLKLTETHFGKEHIQTAWTLLHLGNVYLKLGDLVAAREILTRSSTIHKESMGKDKIQTTWPNLRLGELALIENNFDDAENLILPNVQILKNYNHPARHKALELLGDFYSKKFDFLIQKASPEELNKLKNLSIESYKEAKDLIIKTFPTNSTLRTTIENKIQKIMTK